MCFSVLGLVGKGAQDLGTGDHSFLFSVRLTTPIKLAIGFPNGELWRREIQGLSVMLMSDWFE